MLDIQMKQLQSILAIAAVSVASVASAQQINATVNGDAVDFPDMQPVMMNGRVMVPVRGVFEHMNATVEWHPRMGMVTAKRGNDTIKLPVNSEYATVNGKQVKLDTPAVVRSGRTMVPLRFLSESLGASVEWMSASRTVAISTSMEFHQPINREYVMKSVDSGTVIPFKLNRTLSSNNSAVGDTFTGTIDTGTDNEYQDLPKGTIIEGHVDVARAKTNDAPGVLGLAYDKIKLPDGKEYAIYGSTIGLDSKSVVDENGRLVAKNGSTNNTLKYVGYGAGAGALISLLGKGNLLTNSLIGAALGLAFGSTQNKASYRNVVLEPGLKSGIKLTKDLSFRVKNTQN
ncbi:MAG TPA: copper amine oxidase N-terminal domain-containing protein [Fimbriimonas sp.]|nr:copper amine oxidase N-terminal domain-containing protein [Fimbriimonas sp.]